MGEPRSSTNTLVKRQSKAPSAPSRAGSVLTVVGVLAAALIIAGLLFLSLRPGSAPGGLVFEIPAGAAATIDQPTIDSAVTIPTNIVFAAGEPAAITVINHDNVPHRAGPFLVGAGQTFVQRFPAPGIYPIACSVDPAESIVVEVN